MMFVYDLFGNIEEPNYVLRFKGVQSIPVKGDKWGKVQKVCLSIIGFLFLFSLIFKDNLFGALSGYSVGVLLATLFYSTIRKKMVWASFPVELRFYDDRLVILKDFVPRAKGGTKLRQEWSQFYYKDIRLVRLRLKARRILIQGVVHGIYVWYNEHGQITDKKKYDKITNSGCLIDTHNMGDIDFVKEIESHSPLKVEVHNT